MMSPDEWKSSLPLVFQQNGVSSVANSPTSPSNSIEDLVLELENSSQDVDLGYPFAADPGNVYIFSLFHYAIHFLTDFIKHFITR